VEDKPVVLFATPFLHHPPTGGPVLRIENSIIALSEISHLHIYSRIPLNEIGGEAGLSFYRKYCNGFYFASRVSLNRYVRFVKRCINFLAKRIIKRPVFKINWKTIEDFRYLLKVADNIKADVIWLGYGNISYPLLKYIKTHSNYKVVLDTDSVWSRFVLRGLPYARNKEEYERIEKEGREKEEEEKWGTTLADITAAVSEIDAEYYRMLAMHPQQVHVFSNVIDTIMYQHKPLPPANFKKPCIYLAGTFWRGSPMEEAARWVITEVLPLVRRQIPKMHLYIVGRGSDEILSDIDGPCISITGELHSVLPYLCNADVSLVPLKFESGTRFKILEAGACERPVVSTTLGAEGIPITNEKDILIADEPEMFAAAIVRLIKDPSFSSEMAKNLKRLVHDNYTVASLAVEGRRILEYLLQ